MVSEKSFEKALENLRYQRLGMQSGSLWLLLLELPQLKFSFTVKVATACLIEKMFRYN